MDLLVVGHETEGCLAAVAAARAGARTALLVPPGALLGGLLTEDGLAFVDRDARHLRPPQETPEDGIFAEFLVQAGVPLVALERQRGHETLARLLAGAGVQVIEGESRGVVLEPSAGRQRLKAVDVAGLGAVGARNFIDATPDLDLAERTGMRFATAFEEYGDARALGVSPLPLVHGVTPARIVETCRALQADPALEALRQRVFGDRPFLDLEQGEDYVLVGPPHLGLAYQRWREVHGLTCAHRFEADGFNVAVVGPDSTSWNGLMYFVADAATRLRLSREGADDVFQRETERFGRFLREELGWQDARVELPEGVYVRQTRHALDVRHRLTLEELTRGDATESVGTFCYYPDFRGYHTPRVPGPVTAHVRLGAGLSSGVANLGLAARAGGYTPYAHSLCRLVQYNVTLGAALGMASALAEGDFDVVPATRITAELDRLGIRAADPAGFDANARVLAALREDALIRRETPAWTAATARG